MKSTLALVFGLFAASIYAAPAAVDARTGSDVTVSLINDQSGANAQVTISADGSDQSIKDLFGNTAIGATGNVLASSAQRF